MHDGSSPLARGLQGTRPRTRRPRVDHPRSRGVYNGSRWEVPMGGGSSPLARGLPLRGPPVLRLVRIIPARAGFTSTPAFPASKNGDHPRSRGVYLRCGSRHKRAGGIIPARAGFTAGRYARTACMTDHPRSRGVYKELALELDVPVWIIPARAGFTTAAGGKCRWVADHPRSRGVYHSADPQFFGWSGSSPLARGLHPRPLFRRRRMGIIPARAGFTFAAAVATSVPAGSSPLARGLRCGLG